MEVNLLSTNVSAVSLTNSTSISNTQVSDSMVNDINIEQSNAINFIVDNVITEFPERIFKSSDELSKMSQDEVVFYLKEKLIDYKIPSYIGDLKTWIWGSDPIDALQKGSITGIYSDGYNDRYIDDNFLSNLVVNESFLRDQVNNTFTGDTKEFYLSELDTAFKKSADYFVNKLANDIGNFFNGTDWDLWSDNYANNGVKYLSDPNYTMFDGVKLTNNLEEIYSDNILRIRYEYEQEQKAYTNNVLAKANFNISEFSDNLHNLLYQNKELFQQVKQQYSDSWNSYVSSGRYTNQFKENLQGSLERLSSNLNSGGDTLEGMNYQNVRGVSAIIKAVEKDFEFAGQNLDDTALTLGMIKAKTTLIIDKVGLSSDVKDKLVQAIDNNIKIEQDNFMFRMSKRIDIGYENYLKRLREQDIEFNELQIEKQKNHNLSIISMKLQSTVTTLSDIKNSIQESFLKVIKEISEPVTLINNNLLPDRITQEELKQAKIGHENYIRNLADRAATSWNELVDKYITQNKEQYYLSSLNTSSFNIVI